MAFPRSRALALVSKLHQFSFNSHYSVRYAHSAYSKKLCFNDFGEPMDVVKLAEERMGKPGGNEIIVEMLAAPINPADINTIQGVYPKKPTLPATAGNEGVGRVSAVGTGVTSFKVGDLVIPNDSMMGTWRTHGIWDAKQWFKVPSNIPVIEAATMTVNSLTAYRMLKDFVSLKPGDTIIQNGANSSCGQNVIQLCRAWGLTSVNVVRDRPTIDNLKHCLTQLGASHVLTEEEVRTTTLFSPGGVRPPSLALNCVGGQSGIEILRRLAPGGTMVTYGGMSRSPVTVPTSALIFKDAKVLGFWMTRWQDKNRNTPKAAEMYNDVMNLIIAKKLTAPFHRVVPFCQYEEALKCATDKRGFGGQKIILTFCDK